jgi:hypothetical protein
VPILIPNSTIPRNWERAFGYKGAARWLAAYWTPCGDEAMYDDGQVAATANWRAFQELTSRHRAAITNALVESGACPKDDAWAALYYFGSSDSEASHCMLLDLAERKVYFDEIGPGLQYVTSQHPPAPNTEPIEITSEMLLVQALMSARASTAEQFRGNFRLCSCGNGWVRASDGGYDRCPAGCDNGIVWG